MRDVRVEPAQTPRTDVENRHGAPHLSLMIVADRAPLFEQRSLAHAQTASMKRKILGSEEYADPDNHTIRSQWSPCPSEDKTKPLEYVRNYSCLLTNRDRRGLFYRLSDIIFYTTRLWLGRSFSW